MKLCLECGEAVSAGAPACARCAGLLDAMIEQGWRSFLDREFGAVTPAEERAVAGHADRRRAAHDRRGAADGQVAQAGE